MKRQRILSLLFILSALLQSTGFSQEENTNEDTEKSKYHTIKIKPRETDILIKGAPANPHLIMYDKSKTSGKLFFYIPGTHGKVDKSPINLFETAVEQGYRVISIAYIDDDAVAGACKGESLKQDPDCPYNFRMKRIYGKDVTNVINDKPQDAIIYRFTRLLQYLVKNDKEGHWEKFLVSDSLINWPEITVAGQSQGGGMAAFIAQREKVYRIISFSGGWDYAPGKKIANWYDDKSVTPRDKWYATYNVSEPNAKIISESYVAMKIPASHVIALKLPERPGKKAHGEGIRNPAYKPDWITLLGDGN